MTVKDKRVNASDSKVMVSRALVEEIKKFQDAVDRFDTAVAKALEINSTDLRCLTILNDYGPLLANQVAKALGLTKGATSIALDRLVERKLIRRVQNPNDGRSFSIELTEAGKKQIVSIWKPMRNRGQELMKKFSTQELEIVLRFFSVSIELQRICENDLSKHLK